MAAGLSLLLLAVLVLPASAGVAPRIVLHGTKVIAPFANTTWKPYASTSVSGCATARVVVAPFFHARTGAFGFSGNASSRTCRASTTSNSSSSFEGILAKIPIPGVAGAHFVTVKIAIHVTGGESARLGTCRIPGPTHGSSIGGCYVSAAASLVSILQVYDATNQTSYSLKNQTFTSLQRATYWTVDCFGGPCTVNRTGGAATFTLNTTATWRFAVSGLVPSHLYVMSAYFYAQSSTNNAPWGAAMLAHSHASAWVNFATLGNGAKLLSITFS